jgi:hypothetical protein
MNHSTASVFVFVMLASNLEDSNGLTMDKRKIENEKGTKAVEHFKKITTNKKKI